MRWFSFRKHPQINRSFKNFHSRLDHLVIFEDRHVIVANKPSGILSQQAQKGENTMIELLKSYIKLREKRDGDVFVAAINRLDRFTSGINLFARTSKGAKRLCEEFRCRYVKKKYICIVEGVTPSNQTLSHYLSNTRNQHQSLLRTNCSDKPETEYSEAKLIFTTIGNFSMKNKKLSLLEVILETGLL
jgi:23S rRNA pseudouridine1911/1915/1917 synthase